MGGDRLSETIVSLNHIYALEGGINLPRLECLRRVPFLLARFMQRKL